MRHSNISVFVPHIGCPNMCSFCNQHAISGAESAPTARDVHRICTQAMVEIRDTENTEIAFFGGSFTAIPRDYMEELLEAAQEFIGPGKFKGIRISTRPDCIGREILGLLKSYGVTSIELGAQSMDDEVLEANNRGHSAEDVESASSLIREYGFELGLQMMVGLYKSTRSCELETMERIIKIHPDTVRIYPTVVLSGTKLSELYNSGEYRLMSFDMVVEICAQMLLEFDRAGIKIIKCGLHASDGVEGEQIAGYYHPAFRELCESRIYRTEMERLIAENPADYYTFAVNPKCISKAVGQKKSNQEYFRKAGITVQIIGDDSIPPYKAEINLKY